MQSAKKFYVVWKGRKTGVFTSWGDCKAQIDSFEGALYKSFKTENEAIDAFKMPFHQSIVKNKISSINSGNKPFLDSISVDASWSTSTLKMEYQGVYTKTKKLIFREGPYNNATNNIGEFLAIVHALALCKKNNLNYIIYSDSVTAIAWVKRKKANTKLILVDENKELFSLINRAENWLNNNTYNNKIEKWETKLWGEIPADFGRK